jgi:hypothetical protein
MSRSYKKNAVWVCGSYKKRKNTWNRRVRKITNMLCRKIQVKQNFDGFCFFGNKRKANSTWAFMPYKYRYIYYRNYNEYYAIQTNPNYYKRSRSFAGGHISISEEEIWAFWKIKFISK